MEKDQKAVSSVHANQHSNVKSDGTVSSTTVGEDRVRTKFNVSTSSLVDEIKQKSADLINICEELKKKDGRLGALAQTSYEEAAMWAVKAATA